VSGLPGFTNFRENLFSLRQGARTSASSVAMCVASNSWREGRKISPLGDAGPRDLPAVLRQCVAARDSGIGAGPRVIGVTPSSSKRLRVDSHPYTGLRARSSARELSHRAQCMSPLEGARVDDLQSIAASPQLTLYTRRRRCAYRSQGLSDVLKSSSRGGSASYPPDIGCGMCHNVFCCPKSLLAWLDAAARSAAVRGI